MLVNVTARMASGDTPRSSKYAMRYVKHPGLAAARARDDQQRPVHVLHGGPLGFIENR